MRLAALLVAASLGIGCGGEGEWPKRVTLSSSAFAQHGDGLRLSDGRIVAGGGDFALFLGVQLSLQTRGSDDTGDLFCLQGTHAALADVPTDTQTCPGANTGGWLFRLFLSPATAHANQESEVIGLSAVVRDAGHVALYRLRMLGDAVQLDEQGFLGRATATFEYEPIP